jgi:hypothetical protein
MSRASRDIKDAHSQREEKKKARQSDQWSQQKQNQPPPLATHYDGIINPIP